MTPTAHEYAKTHAQSFRQQLRDWLSIPSVSTLPRQAGAVLEAANWLADNLRRAGIENVEIILTAGHPVVFGDWLGAGDDAPTILVYGHYDVQPAVTADGWDSDPFAPIERDGKIFARGATDDKGQLFTHVKAVESILQTERELPVNVKFVLEGEEEIGSPHLAGVLREYQDRLRAKLCVISDSAILTKDQPSVIYSLRGICALEVTVYGPRTDMHSGSFGGAVHNPLQALAEILARLHHEDGSIAVPGFYDDVLPLREEERGELKKTDYSETEWQQMTGVPQSWGEPDFTIRERIGARPTLEINGLSGGFQGEGIKTVLPAKASAKITCRLVANQNPKRIPQLISDYIAEITPPTVRSEVRVFPIHAHPSLVDIRTPAMEAAIAAYEKGWGKAPVFMREGGSIPIVADFQNILGLPVILMGFGLDTDGAHGPNEHFHVDMFHKGIDTVIHFLYEVGRRL